ncbi:MAG: nitrilase-related carbon-nitrogen hydrolase [Bacteroidales bacterium]
MIAGFIQNDPVFGDKQHNFKQVFALAGNIRADLLVLPELFATGYTFTSVDEAASLAEPVDGPTAQFLSELSSLTGAAVVAGFIEQDGKALYNSSLIVSGNQTLGTYRKIHLFNREKLWFSTGNKAPEVFEAAGCRIGVMICFDWFFPETARTLAFKGAQVIAHPSNLVMPYCQRSMPVRCLENRVFAITANRIGREIRGPDDFHFTGASQVTGHKGDILLQAPTDRPHVALVEFDPALADDKNLNDHNHLFNDRRTDLYR